MLHLGGVVQPAETERELRKQLATARTFLKLALANEKAATKTNLNIDELKQSIKKLEAEVQAVLPTKVRANQCDQAITAANRVIEDAEASDAQDD